MLIWKSIIKSLIYHQRDHQFWYTGNKGILINGKKDVNHFVGDCNIALAIYLVAVALLRILMLVVVDRFHSQYLLVAAIFSDFFHHEGFLDVVPSDVVAGILLVRFQQRIAALKVSPSVSVFMIN